MKLEPERKTEEGKKNKGKQKDICVCISRPVWSSNYILPTLEGGDSPNITEDSYSLRRLKKLPHSRLRDVLSG